MTFIIWKLHKVAIEILKLKIKRYVYKQYGLVGQPETFVIDKNGIIREHYKGPLTKQELYDMVKPYE